MTTQETDHKITQEKLNLNPRSFIRIMISEDCPLNNQLKMMTGDGWNCIDWTDTLATGWIRHKKTDLIVNVL